MQFALPVFFFSSGYTKIKGSDNLEFIIGAAFAALAGLGVGGGVAMFVAGRVGDDGGVRRAVFNRLFAGRSIFPCWVSNAKFRSCALSFALGARYARKAKGYASDCGFLYKNRRIKRFNAYMVACFWEMEGIGAGTHCQ